jgi:hypothetical protein
MLTTEEEVHSSEAEIATSLLRTPLRRPLPAADQARITKFQTTKASLTDPPQRVAGNDAHFELVAC